MIALKFIFIFIFLPYFAICLTKVELANRMTLKLERLKTRARKLYGRVPPRPTKVWEFEVQDRLAYPRGDKQKLHEISEQWLRYYECCVNSLHSVTSLHTLPGRSVAAYAGAVVRMPCGLCVAPPEKDHVIWCYAESLKNLTFQPLEEKDTAVTEDAGLSIYSVRAEDAGVYKCKVGRSEGGLVVLEVVDQEEKYAVVKPPTSHGPYASREKTDGDLTVFTDWTPWSECSRCGKWGRRRRYGMCQVKVTPRSKLEKGVTNKTSAPNHTEETEYCREGQLFLEAFPLGFRCRSRLLPACIADRAAVRERPNEIMIGMCKPSCRQNVIFKLKSHRGVELERANNSANVFSLLQSSRKEVVRTRDNEPQPAIIFAVRGEPAVITCPSKSHRDIPVSWRVGTHKVCERSLARSSEGRVKVNARDQIVFTAVWGGDTNIYSCWQRDVLVGRARLVVCWGCRAALLAAIGATVYALATLAWTRAHTSAGPK